MELEIDVNNDFISVFGDGDVTIQMKKENVRKIFLAFDPYVQKQEDVELSVEVTEDNSLNSSNNTFVLDLILSFEYDNGFFALTGSEKGRCQYSDFDLEYCDLETWNKIGTLI